MTQVNSKLLRFAAIDIGTNAVRLFFGNVIDEEDIENSVFYKSSIIRVPVRLGEDVFENGHIGTDKIEKLSKAMVAFRNLIEIEDCAAYRACATSAMRDAKNSKAVIKAVEKASGIKIEIISGSEEADIIYSTRNTENLESGKNYLSVDLGGGSIEFTLFSNKKTILSHSFNIGTIRLLNNLVSEDEFKLLKNWLKAIKTKYSSIQLIGSGGNINKLFRISKLKDGEPLKYKQIKDIYKLLKSVDYNERMKILELNPDRADVILPAAEIFINVMKWLDVDQIQVPMIGLSDGIARKLYFDYRKNKLNK